MKFFKLLHFVLWVRFKNSVYDLPLKLFWASLVVFITLIQAMLAIFFLNAGLGPELSPQMVKGIINLIIAIFLFLSRFFPSYQPTTKPIWAFHPMRQLQRGLFAMACDIFSFRSAMAMLFIAFLLISPHYSISDFVISLTIIIGAILIERSFRLLLDQKISFLFFHGTILLLILVLFLKSLTGPISGNIFNTTVILVITVFAACFQHVFLSYLSAGNFKAFAMPSIANLFAGHPKNPRKLSSILMLLRLYFQTPSLRNALGIGVTLKTFTLLLFAKIISSGNYPFNSLILFYFVISPAIPFVYILNNAFGHVEPLWLTYRLHTGGAKKVFQLYFQLSMFPVFYDAMLSFGVMFLLKLLNYRFVVFYLGSLLSFFTIGLWASLFKPKSVNPLPSSLFHKNYTSPLFSALLSIPVAVLFTVTMNSSALWILTVCSSVLPLISGYRFLLSYRNLFHKTYSELQKI